MCGLFNNIIIISTFLGCVILGTAVFNVFESSSLKSSLAERNQDTSDISSVFWLLLAIQIERACSLLLTPLLVVLFSKFATFKEIPIKTKIFMGFYFMTICGLMEVFLITYKNMDKTDITSSESNKLANIITLFILCSVLSIIQCILVICGSVLLRHNNTKKIQIEPIPDLNRVVVESDSLF